MFHFKQNTIYLFLLIFSYSFSQKKEVHITTTKLTNQIYMLSGKGGNIGLFIGKDAVLMIDDQFAELTPKILTAIQKITKKPVSYLVNTHWHGDHTGGNKNMKEAGATIIAHENVRKRMSNVEESKKDELALPELTYSNDMMFHINKEDVLVSHVHNAHTDGDSFVYFTKNNVIHMGDLYFQGKFPFIDLNSGGSINGYIDAINKVLLIANDETIIIPGHKNISNKAELITFKNMLLDVRGKIQQEIDHGKTLEEVTNNSALTKKYNSKYGGWFISEDVFRATVYKSLNANK